MNLEVDADANRDLTKVEVEVQDSQNSDGKTVRRDAAVAGIKVGDDLQIHRDDDLRTGQREDKHPAHGQQESVDGPE